MFVDEVVTQFLVFNGYAARRALSRDTRLENLGLTYLDLEDASRALGGLVSASDMDKFQIVGELGHAVVKVLEEQKKVVVPLTSLRSFSPITIWSLEFTQQLESKDGLLDPGRGYDRKYDQLFARLRRLWREHGAEFRTFWKDRSQNDQKCDLFRASPMPLDETDESFPVSLAMLPKVTVSNLMGPHLFTFIQNRIANKKYREVVASDLAHARSISSKFFNRFENKLFALEKRHFVSAEKHQPSDSLLDGQVYGVFVAMISSVERMLISLLEGFLAEKERRAAAQPPKKSICDVCGLFQPKLLVCSKCKSRKFCSQDCQKKDWKTHKTTCVAGATLPLKFEN